MTMRIGVPLLETSKSPRTCNNNVGIKFIKAVFRALSFLICFTFGFAAAEAAIDMNPTVSEQTENGITSKYLVFRDGERQITCELPSRWTHRTGGDSVKLIPPSGSMADIVIKAIPLTGPQPLDERGVAAAREQFVREIPPAAQALTIATEQLNT